MKVEFSLADGWTDILPPVPTDAVIPEWYKKQDSYVAETGGKKKPYVGGVAGTVKRCVPVFDALTMGYMFVTPCDIFVENIQGQNNYTWSMQGFMSFHNRGQAESYPAYTQPTFPKINNPWVIKTPKGYSTLFIPPTNRPNDIVIIQGVVDTDQYLQPVNLPFVLKEGFEGMIPAGTPYAQAIPIKREKWSHSITEIDVKSQRSQIQKLEAVFFDKYKRFVWNKKDYS